MQQHAHKAVLCDPAAVLFSVHSFINHVRCILLSNLQCHWRREKHWERNVAYSLGTGLDYQWLRERKTLY